MNPLDEDVRNPVRFYYRGIRHGLEEARSVLRVWNLDDADPVVADLTAYLNRRIARLAAEEGGEQ